MDAVKTLPGKASSRRERHVLCVDDDEEFLRSLEFFLPQQVNQSGGRGTWYRFVFFADPAEALTALRELVDEGETVAMLISDQMMPSMKGTEFLARARELSEESVRVLLTGHAGIESAITAINERLLDRYLTKPIDSEQDFTISVRDLLQKYEMQITIRDQTDLLQELYDFANTLNAKESLPDTVQAVSEFAAHGLRCQHVSVIAGPGGQELTAVAGRPGPLLRLVPPAAGRAAAVGELGDARVGRAGSLRELAILEGTAESPPSPVLYGVLRVDADLLGLIVAVGPNDGAFDDLQVQIMNYIASTASVALHNQINQTKLQDAWAETRMQASSLADANGRLRILDQLKSDFLGFISHELRTPLSYLSAAVMIDQVDNPQDQKEMAQIVRRGYERLERFITKGLEYFSWIAKAPETRRETTDLVDVVRTAAQKLREGGDAAEIELVLGEKPCVARIDRGPAEEIVHVLLDNAVKFSSGKPVIRVALEAGSVRIQLVVQDRGRGFPPEWSSELFQPFTIVESMRHREGTALSLAKIAAMAQAHGGEIRAHSAGLGQGATFIVELPAATAGAAEPARSRDAELRADERGDSERLAA